MNAGQFVSRLTRKSRSNFFYAFLCLPRAQREAIYACYAFCRIVDDAVDLGQDRTAQRAELARWRDEIARVYEGRAEHPAGQRLQVALRRFPIPRAALEEIIAGVEMDLDHSTYETWDTLYPYCYRVASAVGLCCIEIFGYTDPRAREYAVNLGIAADARRLFAAEIMGRTYFALLGAIEARRFDVFGHRVTLPAPRRVAIALRCWLGSRWARP
jgi:phytoene synthase